MNIAIVGAGNVAWHLAQALQDAGHQITAVYSRTRAHSEELTSHLSGSRVADTLNFSDLPAELVLIAVPDAALAAVAQEIKVKPEVIVAHTSGSQPVSVLANIKGAAIGTFYPVQTFTKHTSVNLQQAPILVEGDSENTARLLELVAQSISRQVERVNSMKRKQLHLAAVFACNFTNHLLGISHELLRKADLPVSLLQPLIRETIKKAAANDPYAVQTGPAIRHDQNVIEAHLQLLQDHPALQTIYQQLTQSIQTKGASDNKDIIL